MANDLASPSDQAPAESIVEAAANVLPFAAHMPAGRHDAEISRNLLLFEEISPLLRNRNGSIDLEGKFAAALGVSAREFAEFAFGASTAFITNTEQQFHSAGFVLESNYFDRLVGETPTGRILKELSVPLKGLKAECAASEKFPNNFLVFRRHPLIEFAENRFLCLDPGFLLDKAGRSLYWTLHDAEVDQKARLQMLSYWASVVERYVDWLFTTTYAGEHRWVFSPRFPNGDEAFDGYLLEGDTLIVFEVKAAVLSVAATYGLSPRKLFDEVAQKAIIGEEGEKKGVAQLHSNLKRLFEGQPLDGLDLSKIRKVYPVLIFLDHGFIAPGLRMLYGQHFDRLSLGKLFQGTITPLFVGTIDDLEIALPFMNRHCFSELLDEYGTKDKHRHGTLGEAIRYKLTGKKPGNQIVADRFKQFSNGIRARLGPPASSLPEGERNNGGGRA